jgi:hypothetical protein
MFLGGMAKDKDVIYAGKTEIQVLEDLVHETLESLDGIL